MTTVDIVKKYVPLGLIAIVLIIVTIVCLFPPFGKMVCEMNSAPGDMSATYTYVVDFSMWRVRNLKVTEVVHSLDDIDLTMYRQEIEETLEKYKNLKYYDSKIVVENKTLTSVVNINYKKINRKALKKIEKGFSNRMMNIYYLKGIYQKNGAVCKNI